MAIGRCRRGRDRSRPRGKAPPLLIPSRPLLDAQYGTGSEAPLTPWWDACTPQAM